MNALHHGDCLKVLPSFQADSVDLCYLDPPFNTGKDFGEFSDKFASIHEYIRFIEERLVAIKRVLKPTGSIYLHCDQNASHYIKVAMDRVFGMRNFRRELIWICENNAGFKSMTENWIRGTDHILYYVMSKDFTFNKLWKPLSEASIRRYDKTDENGRKYMVTSRIHTKERIYLDESKGVPQNNVIDGIKWLKAQNTEIVGYPTQKPVELLELIVKTSSNLNDVVLDPFCGSGTTLVAASNLSRQYIGIDINKKALELAEKRLSLGGLFDGMEE